MVQIRQNHLTTPHRAGLWCLRKGPSRVRTMVIWPSALIQSWADTCFSPCLSTKTLKHVLKFVPTALGCRTLSKAFCACRARLTKLWFFRCMCSRESQVCPMLPLSPNTPSVLVRTCGVSSSQNRRAAGLAWLWGTWFWSVTWRCGKSPTSLVASLVPLETRVSAVADD